eukprot:355876-Chlamydomonas_euryale.AAC.4
MRLVHEAASTRGSRDVWRHCGRVARRPSRCPSAPSSPGLPQLPQGCPRRPGAVPGVPALHLYLYLRKGGGRLVSSLCVWDSSPHMHHTPRCARVGGRGTFRTDEGLSHTDERRAEQLGDP